MRLTVIRKYQRSSIEVPVVQVIREEISRHRLDGAIDSFRLLVRLEMIGLREQIMNIQYLADDLKKPSGGAFAVVGE